MDQPLLDPAKVPALLAGGMGAFASMLFQRNTDRWVIVTTFFSAEVTVYYFSDPIWKLLHASFSWADDGWRGPVSFTLGLIAIFIVGGVVTISQNFAANPLDALGKFIGGIAARLKK